VKNGFLAEDFENETLKEGEQKKINTRTNNQTGIASEGTCTAASFKFYFALGGRENSD